MVAENGQLKEKIGEIQGELDHVQVRLKKDYERRRQDTRNTNVKYR